jgi:type I restriction enzyme M protein
MRFTTAATAAATATGKQTTETALLFLQLIMRKIRRNVGGRHGRVAVVVPESVMSDSGVAQRIRKELVTSYNLHTIVRLPKGVFEPYSDIQTNLLFFDTASATKGIWFYQHEVPSDRQQMRNPCYTQTMPLRLEELAPVLDWWTARKVTDRAWHVTAVEVAKHNYSFDFRNPAHSALDVNLPSAAKNVQQLLTSAGQEVSAGMTKILALNNLDLSGMIRRPLSEFLRKAKYEADVQPDREYKQVTVKLYGKGAVLRGTLKGSEIKTRPQFEAKAGHLIMSRIDARNGAFGIVPPKLDGGLITGDFPLFEVNTANVLPEFLALIVRSSEFIELCKRSSKRTTNRKRLRKSLLLAQEIAVPDDLGVQKLAVEVSNRLKSLRDLLQLAVQGSDTLDSALADQIIAAGNQITKT